MNEKTAKKWLALSDRDFVDGTILLKEDRLIGATFHCHQAVEKALKAYIFSVLDTTPERDKKYKVHDLERLAKFAGLDFNENTWALFDDLNFHYAPTRYEDELDDIFSDMTSEKCGLFFSRAEEIILWIKNKLSQ